MIDLSIDGFRLFMMAFPLVGMQIVASNFFQSIGKAQKAIFLSLTRQLIFLIPLLFVLPKFWGLNGVWLSSAFADILSTFVAFVVLYLEVKYMRQLLKK
jgi:Na+-driven multidrug efflux pump